MLKDGDVQVAPRKYVVILSGGMDSATLLYDLLSQGHEVRALGIDYGQRHSRELDVSLAYTDHIRRLGQKGWGTLAEHVVIDLSRPMSHIIGKADSSQTNPDVPVPLGHYAEESMKKTIVPNRNMVLLALAGSYALATKSDVIAYAAHAGDHAIYPDCRPEFVDALETALQLADWSIVHIDRPYIRMSKTDIVRRGIALGVPYHLTYSCYQGGPNHCGECGTCVERKEAFREAGVYDPTTYDNVDGVSPVPPTINDRY